ncbi:MAG: flagellar basal body P-ring formation chaperone FlgA [Hyphomicrobiaceae bacterium]|nr:flagellar basal body P-ring formation chaperone FlgA [Hyphomicrobiaceae bacterium]
MTALENKTAQGARRAAGFLLAGILTLVFANSSPARAEPLLREQIKVYGDIVTLGDMFENAGDAARAPVFRAPELGTRGVVASKRVKAAARHHGLEWRNLGEIAEVSVHRPSRVVTLDEIRNSISKHIGEADGIWSVSFNRGAKSFHIDPRTKGAPGIKHLDLRRDTGRFRAVISFDGAEHPVPAKTFTGRAYPSVETVVPAAAIKRGETITEDQLKIVRLPRSRVSNAAHKDMTNVVGMAAKKQLIPGRPIMRSDIEPPKLVKRNSLVTIVYRTNGMVLKTMGRALGDAARGEMVSIQNIQSKRTVEAEVTATGTVSVSTKRERPNRNTVRTSRNNAGPNSFVIR